LELHHRFRYFPFSRYYHRLPEIYADAPFRVGPKKSIPITILVKDGHRFPIQLESVQISVQCNSSMIKKTFDINRDIDQPWFEKTFSMEPPERGVPLIIAVEMTVKRQNRTGVVRNHNVPTSSPFDFFVTADDHRLPGSDQFWWGDLHYHSNYTEDFVEFGASLPASKNACSALGLDFLAITDHSYDLDDLPGSWTETDPDLKRWQQSREEIAELNGSGLPLLIPGEEVTSRNMDEKNVHTLVYNLNRYIPGSGDGAERWLHRRSEYATREIASDLTDKELIIAAHPRVRPSRLEQILLNRGIWNSPDGELSGIHGYQILNGRFDNAFHEGLRYWVDQLLTGKKKYIYAGNDAHGNFNAFHQISLPMWSTQMHRNQILGQCRTGVLKTSQLSLDVLLHQLKQGRAIITDGPSINMEIEGEDTCAILGETLNGIGKRIKLNTESSPTWGELSSLQVIHGVIGKQEDIVLSRSLSGYQNTTILDSGEPLNQGYYRAKVVTDKNRQAFSNPVWVE
ncbi:MAG: hypothetical protein GXO90_06880, partial [FCB group bacterium]|nr:hypothetical protein [FCB group bacterium]